MMVVSITRKLMSYATMITIIKRLIYIFMFVLGCYVGYGFSVLHWLSDYVPPNINEPYSTQITNVTSEGGFICYTLVVNQQNNISNTVKCKKQ